MSSSLEQKVVADKAQIIAVEECHHEGWTAPETIGDGARLDKYGNTFDPVTRRCIAHGCLLNCKVGIKARDFQGEKN